MDCNTPINVENDIIKLYDEGHSMRKISELVNLERHTVSRILRSRGIFIRSPGHYRTKEKIPSQDLQKIKENMKFYKGNPSSKAPLALRLQKIHRTQAQKRNKDFTLSDKDVLNLCRAPCFYCGSMPSSYHYRVIEERLNGIDRLDSKKGYNLDNCVSCCIVCNIMKNNFGFQEFMGQIKNIYIRHNKST
jgi:Homeodomain-like domain